ncbi:hypothetical protein ZOSMA_449G00020 [Zostera marina]|uniref:Uncharacterized protein n=1 Tax=Zostera marina TaxID=29655 RepID=A0A0K9P3G2_ZOSMR|nr:hypothetical protein ZOSMA_449G00020 [Zostera marina]
MALPSGFDESILWYIKSAKPDSGFPLFQNRTISVWNFRGELVASFEDHLLWHPDCNTNNIYITSDQDLIISYCKVNCENSIAKAISLLVFRCFLIFFGCYMVICIWMLFFKFRLMD